MKTKYFRFLFFALIFAFLVGCGSDGKDGVAGQDGQDGQDGRILPKHVILFIGDGMHEEHEAAASRYYYGEEEGLIWHDPSVFSYRNYASTWDVTAYNLFADERGEDSYNPTSINARTGYDVVQKGLSSIKKDRYFIDGTASARRATDSASAGTAMATGVKTVDGNIAWLPDDLPGGELKTIAEKVQEQRQGAIGIVTTVPIPHATPAAFVAHNISRNNYVEIIQEIIDITRPDVVIGTAQHMTADQKTAVINDSDYEFFEVTSGMNGSDALLAASDNAVANNSKLFALVWGEQSFAGIQVPTPVVTHVPGAPTFNKAGVESPFLADSTEAALKVLANNRNGFFLMVEQGDIDWSNHVNDYKGMVGGVLDLEEAVKKAIEFVDQPGDDIDWSNTLLIVTSDHGNSMLRTNSRLAPGKGELPEQIQTTSCPTPLWGDFLFCYAYPNGEVFYGTNEHTNELVSVYVKGDFAGDIFSRYEGEMYESGLTKIIDNTSIYKAMANFLGITVSQ